MTGRDCLRQGEVEQNYVSQREAAGKQKRNVGAPATQYPADGGTKNEAQSKRCADQSHSLGAIFFGGDVGDVGLRGRDIAARNSIDDATHKQHRQGSGKTEDQKTKTSSQQADQENRTATILV